MIPGGRVPRGWGIIGDTPAPESRRCWSRLHRSIATINLQNNGAVDPASPQCPGFQDTAC